MEEFCEEVDVDSFPSFRIYKAGKILGDYVGSKNEKVRLWLVTLHLLMLACSQCRWLLWAD